MKFLPALGGSSSRKTASSTSDETDPIVPEEQVLVAVETVPHVGSTPIDLDDDQETCGSDESVAQTSAAPHSLLTQGLAQRQRQITASFCDLVRDLSNSSSKDYCDETKEDDLANLVQQQSALLRQFENLVFRLEREAIDKTTENNELQGQLKYCKGKLMKAGIPFDKRKTRHHSHQSSEIFPIKEITVGKMSKAEKRLYNLDDDDDDAFIRDTKLAEIECDGDRHRYVV